MKLKKFEDYTTVNFSDLVGAKNWSANYHVNKSKGKKPYIKKGEMFIEIDTKKFIPKDAIYLLPEQVAKLNDIAIKLNKLKEEQQEILNKQREILDENLNESVMNLYSLAKVASRPSTHSNYDISDILQLLKNEFKSSGDNGVISTFKELTGISLEALRKGAYVFKHF